MLFLLIEKQSIFVYVYTYGSQRIILTVIPQAPATLLFEIGPLLSLELAK